MKTFKQLNEELMQEDLGMISGPVGLLLGVILVDALGISGAGAFPEKSIMGSIKAGRWTFSKAIAAKVKDAIKNAKIKKEMSALAKDPEVQDLMQNMMQGRAFKPGMKDKGMEILRRKGKNVKEVRDLIDELKKKEMKDG